MREITDAFRAFRECARIVWNGFLRLYPDGEREFVTIESALFDAMLRSQLQTYQPEQSIGNYDFHTGIRIVPRSEKFDLLVGIEEESAWRWNAEEWRVNDVSLFFVGLFDFDVLSGSYREFRYVEAIAVDLNGQSNRAGWRVLIEADGCRIYDISQAENRAAQ